MNIPHSSTNKNWILLGIFLVVILVDFSDLDTSVHTWVCGYFVRKCSLYLFDLPFWEVLVSLGTLLAAYFAYAAIMQSNKQLSLELTPYLVLISRIHTSSDNSVIGIEVENVGKGTAVNARVSADSEGKISLADSSNPHSQNISAGKRATWAIDDNQLKSGLVAQDVISKATLTKLPKSIHVFDIIPDELALLDKEKDKSDFNIYLWYEDQLSNKLRTKVVVRHSGYFLKVMSHTVEKIY